MRLTSSARVEGDIIHKTIAIESGAHFEGSVQRQDDPLATTRKKADDPVTSAPANSGGAARSAAAPASSAPAQANAPAKAPSSPSPAVKAATDQRKTTDKPKNEPSNS